jgi:hypothetical protein
MALNLTALPEYVSQKSKEFVKDAVLGAQTVDILKNAGSVQFGIKGKAAVNTLSVDVNFQSGIGCGRNPVGDTTIGQSIIEVIPLKDEQNYCPKSMENKWLSQYLTQGQTYSELLFAEEFMAARAAKIAEQNEKLIWMGDTALVGATNNLNKLDGFVKRVKAGSAVVVPVAGTTIIDKLQNLFLGAPKATSTSSDAVIFIGTDMFQDYTMQLAKLNLFSPTGDKTLFGTTIKLAPVDGLIGSKFALLAKPQNLIYGTDLVNEEETATMDYSLETKQIYVDFHWSFGVLPVKVSEMAYIQLP